MDELYSIPCRCKNSEGQECKNNGIISYLISSDVHLCKYCRSELIVAESKKKAMSSYVCSNCGKTVNLSGENGISSLLEKRRPVLVRYFCLNCKCREKIHKRKITQTDRIFLDRTTERLEKEAMGLWFPDTPLVYNRAYPRPGGWPGIGPKGRIPDLFSSRNLLALASLFREIEKIKHQDIQEFFRFCFIGSLIRSSNRVLTTSVFKEHYRVPPVGKEANVWQVFERKFSYILQVKKQLAEKIGFVNYGENVQVLQRSAETVPLRDNSVDYVFLDPPYGGYIPFYELNLFYSAWLKQEEDFEHEIIIPMDFEKKTGYVEKWGNMMVQPLMEIKRVLKPGRYVTLAFHSNFISMWNELRRLMLDELGFRFVRIIPVIRGTTFHMNRDDDTIPTTAYITYQKPASVDKGRIHLSGDEITDMADEILRRHPLGASFREIQGEIIRVAHERNLPRIPSEEEIHRALVRGGYRFDPESGLWKLKWHS